MADVACNTTSKESPKKGESSKGSKKTWSPSEEEYLISRWAQADCLFNTCSADYKRQEKKIAARVDIQRALNDQLLHSSYISAYAYVYVAAVFPCAYVERVTT